ncbi:MAG: deoxyribonuclease IV [Deltaproteobacteria bacterium]|nr:MAG: deoxyribonuclease IV [Deltaproteobacteria bacterium]RLC13564.1 MAG: deoxyribonuclease IV [Deltaproteobacteria bacterium]HHE74587.1 deoxyribonuclease IV [Desulfobacteraceae bacterium]
MSAINSINATNLILGAHFSIAKGFHDAVYQAKSYGCNALQMFTKNATTWKERTVTQAEQERFEQAKTDTGIQSIATHTSYLINLASPDPKKHAMSYGALKQEIIRSSALKIPFCVLHPGAHMVSGIDAGLLKISETINRLFSETEEATSRLLLETTAGQGSGLGHTFEQLAEIINRIERKERIGICLDTCHIFAAGYDIRTQETYQQTMNHFDATLGLNLLFVIHINDSKKDLGSRVDRHTHIGKGALGVDAFKHILNDEKLFHVPKLLETAKKEGDIDWDQRNFDLLRSIGPD